MVKASGMGLIFIMFQSEACVARGFTPSFGEYPYCQGLPKVQIHAQRC